MFDDVISTLPIASLVSLVGIFFIYDNWRQANKAHSLSKIVACFAFGILGFVLPAGLTSFFIILGMAFVVVVCSVRDVLVAQRRERGGPQPWHW